MVDRCFGSGRNQSAREATFSEHFGERCESRLCSDCRRRPRCLQRLHRMRNPTPEFDGRPAQTCPSVHAAEMKARQLIGPLRLGVDFHLELTQ